ncbi:hypothetical protein CROQUDRAFT_86122 [Cronartium quercuum f. sp. fusiforme G11]|uniref:Uncharacterized protein n=1 Tax=Cronartium quercuum f. sp. fusiforme G11 TaxID=708437 RepID=A0A9P6THB6_9BASI|nr:hypothetical protein CROQUDRAFT_86122 [Cronartium quercuum f. sp. fusiforme G11]
MKKVAYRVRINMQMERVVRRRPVRIVRVRLATNSKVNSLGFTCPQFHLKTTTLNPLQASTTTLNLFTTLLFPLTNHLSAELLRLVEAILPNAALVNARNCQVTEWDSVLVPSVSLAFPPSEVSSKASVVVCEVLEQSAKEEGDTVEVFDNEEEG